MTLNSSGPISLGGTTAGQSIEIENGGNGTTTISLNDAAVRTLAGVPSGAIAMPTNFWGKSNRVAISYTFTTNTGNASLALSAISGYSAGKSDVTITVNTGVYLWSNAVATAGLTLTGGTTGDTVKLVNNGYIMGQGGLGGNAPSGVGGSAGVALSIGYNISLTNNAYIGGGGGGGGSNGRAVTSDCGAAGGGGGAGGGAGGSAHYAGGNGGAIGASGTNGLGCTVAGVGMGGGSGGGGGAKYCNCSVGHGGGGGGKIFPGTGGAGGTCNSSAAGGSSNAVGGNATYCGAGGGGGWGASGGIGFGATGYLTTAGGVGGKAISLNGHTVTYITTGNVWGAVA